MNPDRWQKACELFEQAVQRPAAERPVFLAETCGGDAELRGEVESLLASDVRAESAFEQLPAAVVSAASGDALSPPGRGSGEGLVGKRIGHYEIKRVIGSGGMSTVYEAVQDSPRRIVALKMMKPGVVSRGALRRFQFESETLARLRHPNIAQIYEAGTCVPEGSGPPQADPPIPMAEFRVQGSGDARSPSPFEGEGRGEAEAPSPSQVAGSPWREEGWGEGDAPSPSQGEGWGEGIAIPWFAMEYLPNARPITDYARDAKLTTRQRLELFVKVCHAVAHGHEKGIIHRDLKPANILVADEGSLTAETQRAQREGSFLSALNASAVKVIDFGIARATDSDLSVTRETQAGALIGTLQYMSPEQCDPGHALPLPPRERAGVRVDIDTRSDVYSLGVVLYELLADRLPYDISTTTVYRAIKIVMEQSPEPLFSKGSEFRVQDSADRRSPSPSRGRSLGEGAPRSPSPSKGEGRGEGATPSPCKGEGRGEGGPRRRKSKIRRSELRDVEAIVSKALSKDPTRRYRSAGDLAADLKRHLRGDPIEARPPTRWERSVRWITRHPTWATAGFCLLLVLTTVASTAFSVRAVNSRPHALELRNERCEAQLVALSSRPLRNEAWRTTDSHGFTLAELVKNPTQRGPKKLVLLNFALQDNVPYCGRICAFDANSPENPPVWTFAPIEDSDLPVGWFRLHGGADQFHVQQAMIIDAFHEPENPGNEVVVIFTCAWSARCVRIYDVAGHVLYQAWLDGAVQRDHGVYWMKDAGLLVFLLQDSSRHFVDGEATGEPGPEPILMLALSLQRRIRSTHFVRPYERGSDRTVHGCWCRRLPDISARRELAYPDESGSTDPGRAVQLNLTLELGLPNNPGCSWVIDQTGSIISGPLRNNVYKIAQINGLVELPDPATLTPMPFDVTVAQPPRRPSAPDWH